MKIWQKLALVKILLLFFWPTTVFAAMAVTADTDPFSAISLSQIIVMLVVSVLSGVTALVIRLDADYRSNKKIKNIKLFVMSHMLGSLLAGVLAFALAQHNNFSIWWELTTVILASFSGAKFVEKLASIYTDGAKIDN